MAFIRFTNNTCKTVSHEKGVEVFRIQHGLQKASESYVAAVKTVHKVYLAWELAPDDYKAAYPRSEAHTALPVVVQVRLPYKE